uniref:Nucleotide-diphospho-sugar transferase domain-containing protein n=1 Tax=viral metagenome TaxID=1070528 RepID=A0A6C0E5L7_9ZZZZ
MTLIFLSFNLNVNLQQEKSSYFIPKTIWVYWDNPELPKLIDLIKENNATKLQDWEIIYLNELNIDNYISKDVYPEKFNTLGIQHKADWIRLYLLNKHGGTWIDASIIINDINAVVKLYNDSIKIQSQFTGFNFKNYENGAFSNKGVPLYVENWFIMVPINSKVINLWLIQYERAIQMGFQNYRKLLDVEKIDTSKVYPNSSGVYLTQHACLQYVFQKQLDFSSTPTIILPAENDMLKIRFDCKLNNECTMNTIKNRGDEVYSLPYIKLVSGERNSGIDISDYFQR